MHSVCERGWHKCIQSSLTSLFQVLDYAGKRCLCFALFNSRRYSQVQWFSRWWLDHRTAFYRYWYIICHWWKWACIQGCSGHLSITESLIYQTSLVPSRYWFYRRWFSARHFRSSSCTKVRSRSRDNTHWWVKGWCSWGAGHHSTLWIWKLDAITVSFRTLWT